MDTSSLHFVDSTLSQYRNELLFHPRKKLPAKDVNDAAAGNNGSTGKGQGHPDYPPERQVRICPRFE